MCGCYSQYATLTSLQIAVYYDFWMLHHLLSGGFCVQTTNIAVIVLAIMNIIETVHF